MPKEHIARNDPDGGFVRTYCGLSENRPINITWYHAVNSHKNEIIVKSVSKYGRNI